MAPTKAGRSTGREDKQADPPGKRKLILALRRLLEEKHFNAITTAEIARAAATNEALIYRYFGDKRGLLHRVLTEYMEETQNWIVSTIRDIDDPVPRLERIIWDSFDVYNRRRVFAKIVLIEVRNFPGYFESEAYRLVKDYARLVVENIEEAVENGQFRSDIEPAQIRDVIIGTVEHLSMSAVIFDRNIDPDAYTKVVCEILFKGVATEELKQTLESAGQAR